MEGRREWSVAGVRGGIRGRRGARLERFHGRR